LNKIVNYMIIMNIISSFYKETFKGMLYTELKRSYFISMVQAIISSFVEKYNFVLNCH